MFKTLATVAWYLAAGFAMAQSLPEMRMTPVEIRASALDNNQIGSSGVAGVHTKVLFGDPARSGFYSILLFVPAHTTILAHSHRDDRVATVVSGEWHFGYGDHFDAQQLKTLPPGSVYSEPGGHNHFARTDADPVIVQISGNGSHRHPILRSGQRSQGPREEMIGILLAPCSAAPKPFG